MADPTQEPTAEPREELFPQEEFFENTPTDVEIEEQESQDSSTGSKPWDPAKIRISTKPFSLRQIADMIDDKDIDLAPDFQRLYVWKPAQKSRLIESVLLGIPLPAFYFNQDDRGTLQVVDGVQRLTTIYNFMKNRDRLFDLEYLKDNNNNRFEDLDPLLRRRFQQTQIFVNVIEPQTPDDVKFDVFKRINTGGSPLTAQEIRHCMSRDRSRDLLKTLVSLECFHQATADAFRQERRMANREVALRFCAFRRIEKIDDYRDFDSLDSFLLDFTRQVDGTHGVIPQLSDEVLERLQRDFSTAMSNAVAIFGNAAFRRYPTSSTRRGPINRALFESWSVALAAYEPRVLKAHAKKIFKAARRSMEEPGYIAATTQGTGDPSKVKLRFSVPHEIIGGFLS